MDKTPPPSPRAFLLPEPAPDEPSAEPPGALWHPKAPAPLLGEVKSLLEASEVLLGYAETATAAPHPEGAPWWLVLTDRRCGLLALADGPAPLSSWRALPEEALRVQRRLTRDEFSLGAEPLFLGPLVGGAPLRRLAELSSLPSPQRLLEAAIDHIDASQLPEAQRLLTRAWHRLDAEACHEAAPEDRDPHTLALLTQLLLRSAQAWWRLKEEGRASAAMLQAADLTPNEDFLLSTEALGLHGEAWWLTLATTLQAVARWAPAARVWARLYREKNKQDLYLLQQARALTQAQDHDQALAHYDLFLATRAAQDTFGLIETGEEPGDDPTQTGADPERAAALLESGQVLEMKGENKGAFARYLDMLREAPWDPASYLHLLRLAERMQHTPDVLGRAVQILRLVYPDKATELERELGPLPGAPPSVSLPARYAPLGEEAYGKTVHPREREASALTQKWIGGLIADSQDSTDILRHCPRLSLTEQPTRRQLLTEVAALLQLPTPACYLSAGTTGIEARQGERDNFLLLGAAHLDPAHERHLSVPAFCFAVATQMAHIRAEHLLLTNSEFWRSFGQKAFDVGLAALSFLPMASWVGKLTDATALKWIAALHQKAEGEWLKKALHLAQDQVKEGKVGASAQSALGAALEQARAAPAQEPRDSLIKEQLASFARGALYSADRVGLLANDDLEAAVEAIFLLSPQALEELPAVRSHGLAKVLARRNPGGALRYHELALRLGELFKFALSDDYAQLRAQTFAPTQDLA